MNENKRLYVIPLVDAGLSQNFFIGKLSFRNNDCNYKLTVTETPNKPLSKLILSTIGMPYEPNMFNQIDIIQIRCDFLNFMLNKYQ